MVLLAGVRLLDDDLRVEQHVAQEDEQPAVQLCLEHHGAPAKHPGAQAHHGKQADGLRKGTATVSHVVIRGIA